VIVRPVPEGPDPALLLAHLGADKEGFLLDGAFDPADEGARSFLGLNAVAIVEPGGDALAGGCDALEAWCDRSAEGPDGGCPGPRAVGFVSYEAGRFVERVPLAPGPALSPDVRFAVYDAVYVHDHASKRAWIEADDARAADRLDAAIRAPLPGLPDPPVVEAATSNMAEGAFRQMVQGALELIAAGEIYQVNLAQRFRAKVSTGDAGAVPLYAQLRRAAPAPFCGLLPHGDGHVLSLSPERFLRWDPITHEIETRPIKGTRPRAADPRQDAALARELEGDAKERAEHLMIVDLERNDLGRVAVPGTVRVEGFSRLRALPRIHHLVSTVRARTRDDVRLQDVLRATFPGGSITGAPKVRAMEVIASMEPERRGVYTGALGHVDRRGGVDLAIAIRTAVLAKGELSFHVGGGIVADSDPERERQETLTKAAAMLEACGG